ncbi:MAG: SixA phosphatase family protein [Acidimicrobiia bacterium]
MRTLMLMRHAKSDWAADYESDHERPLNDRGVRSARVMGKVLASEELIPPVAISSTALRARTTLELAIEAGEWDTELRLDRALYESGPQGVLAVGASAPDVRRLMLVGHQPTWSMLVARLTGERVDLKTATVAVIELELDSWDALPEAAGSLSRILTPRSFNRRL